MARNFSDEFERLRNFIIYNISGSAIINVLGLFRDGVDNNY